MPTMAAEIPSNAGSAMPATPPTAESAVPMPPIDETTAGLPIIPITVARLEN